MKNIPSKRIWQGAVGVALTPRRRHDGEYFWTFSFVRAYKRKGSDAWEYTTHYAQKHAQALGVVMSKAFQFIEQTPAAEFARSQAAVADRSENDLPMPETATTH